MKFIQYLQEEYMDISADHTGTNAYPIFKNPVASEFKELLKFDYGYIIRFILTENDLYVTNYRLFHILMAKKLGIEDKVMFRGQGGIKYNKITIDDIRIDKHRTREEIDSKPWPQKRYFINWDKHFKGARIDASVL